MPAARLSHPAAEASRARSARRECPRLVPCAGLPMSPLRPPPALPTWSSRPRAASPTPQPKAVERMARDVSVLPPGGGPVPAPAVIRPGPPPQISEHARRSRAAERSEGIRAGADGSERERSGERSEPEHRAEIPPRRSRGAGDEHGHATLLARPDPPRAGSPCPPSALPTPSSRPLSLDAPHQNNPRPPSPSSAITPTPTRSAARRSDPPRAAPGHRRSNPHAHSPATRPDRARSRRSRRPHDPRRPGTTPCARSL